MNIRSDSLPHGLLDHTYRDRFRGPRSKLRSIAQSPRFRIGVLSTCFGPSKNLASITALEIPSRA
jgi:hypothetical protein